MSSLSRKRLLSPSEIDADSPPIKKQKLSNDLFRNSADQKQFKKILEAINSSKLVEILNIKQSIKAEIAEFATGLFQHCANKNCMNDISILNEDKSEYNEDHSNAIKFGFKWCQYSDNYFCKECMDKAKPNDCKYSIGDSYRHCPEFQLVFIPQCSKCRVCRSMLLCHCHGVCKKCDFKACFDCYEMRDCNVCKQQFCKKCSVEPDELIGSEADGCICNICHVDTIIECNKCNGKCPLKYKSNRHLYCYDERRGNTKFEMINCKLKGCDIFVCFNCNEKERNGKKLIFEDGTSGAVCNQHERTILNYLIGKKIKYKII